jgi:hypothetical protein
MLHPIFAANIEPWLEAIFLLVMGFLWLINRISTAIEAARRPPPVRRPAQPVPPQADGPPVQQMQARQPVPPQAQPRPASDALQGEIEEFLRRASGRRDGNQQQRQGQRPTPARPAVANGKTDPRRSRPAPPAVRAKPVVKPPAEMADTPEAITQHVKQFLDMREFDKRTSNLSTIDEQEREFEQKVKQTFSHELGHLKPSTLADGGDSAATAALLAPPQLNSNVLAGLFRSGIDLKRAIALNEIFQRPEHRW